MVKPTIWRKWKDPRCWGTFLHKYETEKKHERESRLQIVRLLICITYALKAHLADESSKVKGGNLWRHTTEVCLTDSIQNLNVYLCLSPGFRPETVFFTTFVSEVHQPFYYFFCFFNPSLNRSKHNCVKDYYYLVGFYCRVKA